MPVDALAGAPRERRNRMRLHGTAQVDDQGVSSTGAFIHDKTDSASADRLCAVGDHIVATRAPWMSSGRLYRMPDRPCSRLESIPPPLSGDDGVVNMILGLTVFL